ncbi:MAG: VCBS repeat-containing protein [Phycisphaerae bacterium]|jgi:hypothetical protein|nr:VCBS repeat-containing protein [Phycisphaerae bacterium]
MNHAKSRSILFVLTVAVSVVCLQIWTPSTVSGATKTKKSKGSKPSGNLNQYYGFGPMEILKLQWGLGAPSIADINHDGLNDIITTNNSKARIELLLQKKDFDPKAKVTVEIRDNNINDVFGRERTWRFHRTSYDLDVSASAVIAADLNSDGMLDLAYNTKEALYITLQKTPGKPVAKSGNKKPAKTGAPTGQTPREPLWLTAKRISISGALQMSHAMACGDLNGDKRTDIALLGGDGTFVLLQSADGKMGQPQKLYSSSRRARKLMIGDINADGFDDIVVLTTERAFPLRVRFQTSDGKLGPEVRLAMTTPGAVELIKLGKRNCLAAISAHSGRVQIWALGKQKDKETYPVFTYPLPAAESAGKRDIVSADVDGDGLSDVVVSDPSAAEFLLYQASAKTSLTSAKRFPGLTDMQKLCSGDLDGRGKDAVVSLSIKEKLVAVTRFEAGRLTFPKSINVKDEPVAIDLADVNGDSKLDLLYIARDKKADKFFLRTVMSVGRKDAKPGNPVELSEVTERPQDIRTADIDNDGRCDAIIIKSYGPLLLIRQNKTGKFEQVSKGDIHSGLVNNVLASSMSIGPLGPKGAAALLLARKKFARSLIFGPEGRWRVVDQYPAVNQQSNVVAAAACRLPGRKDVTIVTYDTARERLGILARKADGTYRTDKELEIGSVSVRKILAGNFGGSSPLSLLVCGTSKLIRIPLTGQTHQLAKIASFEPDVKTGRYGALTAGDVNSDEKPDIVLCEQITRHVEILTFNPRAKLVAATKFKVFEQAQAPQRDKWDNKPVSGQPKIAVLGDVTGDGKSDLVILVHDRLIVYPQD